MNDGIYYLEAGLESCDVKSKLSLYYSSRHKPFRSVKAVKGMLLVLTRVKLFVAKMFIPWLMLIETVENYELVLPTVTHKDVASYPPTT